MSDIKPEKTRTEKGQPYQYVFMFSNADTDKNEKINFRRYQQGDISLDVTDKNGKIYFRRYQEDIINISCTDKNEKNDFRRLMMDITAIRTVNNNRFSITPTDLMPQKRNQVGSATQIPDLFNRPDGQKQRSGRLQALIFTLFNRPDIQKSHSGR